VTLADVISSDFAAFAAASEFGETVVYRPKSGAGPFTIPAVVLRHEPRAAAGDQRAQYRGAHVHVRYSTNTALGIATPSESGDALDVVLRHGQPAQTCRVKSVRVGLPGRWILEVAG
jgi:hypothetical protein